jgi:hypothetical protein
MFDIEICPPRQIVLVRLHGMLSEDDFRSLDGLASQARGRAEYDCIFDLSQVERVDLATEFIAKRGSLPQAFTNRQRIYVVPQDDLKLLVRLYASYQAAQGWRPPAIVQSLDEALAMLGVGLSEFRAVSLPRG